MFAHPCRGVYWDGARKPDKDKMRLGWHIACMT